MTARAIIPAPTLFDRFLAISGLKTPVAFLCTYVLEPICDRIIDRLDPVAVYPIQAEGVRNIAKEIGLDDFPVVFSERQSCPTCGKLVLMLVQPENFCWDCWTTIER